MGHGKETPRQKMIGMMYLFLTAMLALNVSKDVLNSFVLVHDSLSNTIENFIAKNDRVYNEFEKRNTENPEKVREQYEKAVDIHKMADELYELILDQKIAIIHLADGDDAEAVEDRKIHSALIKAKDNTDYPATYMLNEGHGTEMKEKIIQFREKLLEYVGTDNEILVHAIEQNLYTEDPPPHEGQQHSWESEHFEHLPMIAVLTMMSKIQSDVRNAEADAINYLFTQIDASSFKFNKLEPTVIARSNYVLKGGNYEADVFLAAFDTTKAPTILIGEYDSVNRTMVGAFDSLPIEKGRGKFVVPASAVGYKPWGGIIRIKSPDGELKDYPFKAEYQVAEASLIVSPTKMNVFYLGVDNPVEISVPGVPSDRIQASISNGTIRSDRRGGWIVKPARAGRDAVISVSAEVNGEKRTMPVKKFRVKVVPNPVAVIAGKKGGQLRKNVLLAQRGVLAQMEDFDFDLTFRITEFTVSANVGGFFNEKKAKGNKFTPDQLKLINGMKRGQKVIIEDIKAVGPDGSTRKLNSIVFKIM
jgi:gliding motility-associated protein GldM